MTFTTSVDIARSPWPIRYQDRILLLGSCFSDRIAAKLDEYAFQVVANPTGTLYNPISVARHIEDVPFDVAIITLGTAWVYVDKARLRDGVCWQDAVVDNCEKRPASDFERRCMTVDEIVALWQPIMERHADKRFIFTVSPIRHIKDGLHANQLSKATLLLAIHQFLIPSIHQSIIPSIHHSYFPSYEILLDELRDYRFYASDMMHPSDTAVEYIWERFADTYFFEEDTRHTMKELHQWWLDCHHRPLHPESAEYAAFREQLSLRTRQLQLKYPFLSLNS